MITLEYYPLIKKAEYHSSYTIGERLIAISMDNIPRRRTVHYKYIVMIWDKYLKEAIYFIASESNSFNKEVQFLGVFGDEFSTHINLGASDLWKDQNSFITEAINIVERKFEKKALEIKSENEMGKSKKILEFWIDQSFPNKTSDSFE